MLFERKMKIFTVSLNLKKKIFTFRALESLLRIFKTPPQLLIKMFNYVKKTYLIGKLYFISVHEINPDTFLRPKRLKGISSLPRLLFFANSVIFTFLKPVSAKLTYMIYTFRTVFVYGIQPHTSLIRFSS